MGKLYCLIGKSGSGKDTVLSEILKKNIPDLKLLVTYTTRPRRSGETDGVEYHFVDEKEMERLEAEGNIIEKRHYNTNQGIWYYFTGHTELDTNYIMIGTPDVVDKLYEHYSRECIKVIYLRLDEKERLLRCINRESKQKTPDYTEVCRRFVADSEDFNDERMKKYDLEIIDSGGSVEENTEACIKLIR